MVCTDCKGEGHVHTYVDLGVIADCEEYRWDEDECPTCKGKGYLTPKEAGLGKF